jgi:hypothetical protein
LRWRVDVPTNEKLKDRKANGTAFFNVAAITDKGLPPIFAPIRASSQQGKMAKSKRGLDKRHRDKSGRIERKHGNTKVAALRKEYGEGFAKGRRTDLMLKTLLRETGCASLHDYLSGVP